MYTLCMCARFLIQYFAYLPGCLFLLFFPLDALKAINMERGFKLVCQLALNGTAR